MLCGFAWSTRVTNNNNQQFFQFRTAAAAVVCSIRVNSSTGKLEVLNSANSVIATGTTVFVSGYRFIEIKAFANGASGTVEVHVDGVVEIASTTVNIGSTAIGQVLFQNVASGGTVGLATTVDDIYVLNTSGSTNNTFLGDSRVATVWPSGAGSHTQWTPLSGANYTNVDETTPDGDTTYNFDSSVGDIDSFPTVGVDADATVYGVQTNLYARKDDTGTRQIADVIRQGSTDYVGSTVTLASGYSFYSQIHDQDPTGSDWTAATVNADEFGYKLVA
jgi:hypothetical protein